MRRRDRRQRRAVRTDGAQDQRRRPVDRDGELTGVTVAALGPHLQGRHRRPARLPGARDHRDARRRGAKVRAFDPTTTGARRPPGDVLAGIELLDDPLDAATAPTSSPCSPSGTTSRELDLVRLRPTCMRGAAVVDCRNLLDRDAGPRRRLRRTTASASLIARRILSPAAPASSARTSATACSPAVTTSSASTTSSPDARRTSSTSPATRAFTLVEHDVTSTPPSMPRARPLDAVMNLASPASPPDYLRDAARDARRRQHRHPQPARRRASPRRPVLPRLDERGVRRPARAPPARVVLGQRQPHRRAHRATTRRSDSPRRSRWRTTACTALDVRIVRIFNTYGPRMQAGRRSRGRRTSSSRRCAASPSRSTATAPRPAASATSPTRCAASSPCSTATSPAR